MLRPRPRPAVPDGAAWAARGRRAGGARLGEAGARLRDEYRRKIRMFEHCWLILLRGRVLRRLAGYTCEIVSHRHLRYASGPLHLLLLASSIAARPHAAPLPGGARRPARRSLLAPPRPGIARYYVLVTCATIPRSLNYLRAGVPPVWEKAEGTR